MTNSRTDLWKLTSICSAEKQYLFRVTLLKIAIFQYDLAFNKVLQTRFPRFKRFQNGYKFASAKSSAKTTKRATVHDLALNYETERFLGSLTMFINRTYFINHTSSKLSDIGFLSGHRATFTQFNMAETREASCCSVKVEKFQISENASPS